VAIHCSYDPESRGGTTADERRVRGTSHWVSASEGVDIEVHLYDKLFSSEYPGEATGDYLDDLNPDSLVIIPNAKAEAEIKNTAVGDYLQFIRNGYFCLDSKYAAEGKQVYNRTVTLRDSWARMKQKMGI
jgi:glutaminyl-tRNA synthetase